MGTRLGPRHLYVATLAAAAMLLTSCAPSAQIRNNIISTDVSGYADDADSNVPRDNYRGPGDLSAQDVETKASSVQPTYNTVSGSADAVPRDPSANTVEGDEAIGASRNKVISEFVVQRRGNFTFNIELKVEDLEFVHDGKVFVSVRANVLDAQGQTLPPNINSGIASLDFEFRPGGQVIINGDENNPAQTTGNDYNQTASGPNRGVDLGPGRYQLELSLNIRAHAPVLVGPDGRKHEAHVKNATATITLR